MKKLIYTFFKFTKYTIYMAITVTLVIGSFVVRESRAPKLDNPRTALGRVYLKNGNYFDGSIDIDSEGKIVVYSDDRGLKFSPARVKEIKLANGKQVGPGSLGTLNNRYANLNTLETRFDTIIKRYARIHGVEEELLKAVINQESGFNPVAISHKGARGLMQLMPQTAQNYGVKDIFDPVENIDAGSKHLAYLINKYNGDKRLALAAYNAGSTRVKKYNGIPPFRETANYVRIVYQNYRRLKEGDL